MERGREAFARQAWAVAYAELSVAAGESLDVDDLERLAAAAYLTGRDDEAFEAWTRAHHLCAESDDVTRALRCAFWLAFGLLNRGEVARGSGWIDRAGRLLESDHPDCVERGYLRYAAALRSVFEGDVLDAHAGFAEAVHIADRFKGAELTTLARIGEGRCLIYAGEIATGVALLDEAMVSVGAREVSPIAVGDAYCTVIEACNELFDLRRTHAWTRALSEWCESQPELVLYRGQCLLHRAEIMQLRGAWTDALVEVDRARARLAKPAHQMLGAAHYLRGELYRVRGDLAMAAEAYREANEFGYEPQPGLALLRVAEGRREAASAAIRRLVDEAQDPVSRARLLGPFVEIVLDDGDVEGARAAADELSSIATTLNADYLRAAGGAAMGAVLVASGDSRGALVALRQAWTLWRELDAPYEAARTRVLIAAACRALGDDDSAEMELDAARVAFAALGAQPDLARVDALSQLTTGKGVAGLTARELEVLVLLASGKTNREIAEELVVSEKTVASHVSHIFTKLGLANRSAATAYAYENGLV